MGALCGEAVVFSRGNRPPCFSTSVKQRGALLAKGRLLGVQFDALFTNNLYAEIGRHGIEMAEQLKQIIREKGLRFWEKFDDSHTVVRFATSWSTTQADLDELRQIL